MTAPDLPTPATVRALVAAGRGREAEATLRAAVARFPDHAEPWFCLGVLLARLGRDGEALAAYDECLDRAPGHRLALFNRANLSQRHGREARAEQDLRAVLAAHPTFAAAWINLSGVLRTRQCLEEAEAACDRALALMPDSAEAWFNLGTVRRDRDRLWAAATAFRTAVVHRPELVVGWVNLGIARQECGDQEGAVAALDHALTLAPDHPLAAANRLLLLHYDPRLTQRERVAAIRAWAARTLPPAPPPLPVSGPDPHRPLTVGLVGATFRRHPTLWLTLAALEALDPARIRLVVFDLGDRPHDDFSHRLRDIAVAWHALGRCSDAQALAALRGANLDVALGYEGFTGGRWVTLLAHRVAPVQVNWSAWTSGLPAMEALLTDAVSLPPGSDHEVTERPWRLPDDYVVYRPPEDAPDPGPLPADRNGALTFAAFHAPAKINGVLLARWGRVLAAVPKARIVFAGRGFDEPALVAHWRERAGAAGLDPARLAFTGPRPHRAFLALYQGVDVMLDAWPYSAGLTACESLWMGVPVLTVPGSGMSGRHAAAHLTAAGMAADWICADEDTLIARARALDTAAGRAALRRLRAELRLRVAGSALCDGPRFARHLETALRALWRERGGGSGTLPRGPVS